MKLLKSGLTITSGIKTRGFSRNSIVLENKTRSSVNLDHWGNFLKKSLYLDYHILLNPPTTDTNQQIHSLHSAPESIVLFTSIPPTTKHKPFPSQPPPYIYVGYATKHQQQHFTFQSYV